MPDNLPPHDRPEVHAILGPTNTGKTHHAIERMLQHRTGVIGLPLRLLAREVYERVAARRGEGSVALITGEEKIAPANARYRVCTTEAMSSQPGGDLVAIDEIQVAADPERGHVFTDRLLHARGYRETLLLGSASMEARIRQLAPEARISGRERRSELSYGGRVRLEALPPRTAIVAFSAAEVYEIASIIRRRRGGAAVVLGALSPRTRNAQVELFQSGDVDTIVATDAIGMGLNLDLDVVAFTRLSKFDGERMRRLRPEEIGQIAGRAGRNRRPGSFVVADWEEELHPALARAVEEQRFPSVPVLRWRNAELGFASVSDLLDSLLVRPGRPGLARPREGSDLRALQILSQDASVRKRAASYDAVRLLWNACRLPDYPAISAERHAGLVREIFLALSSPHGSLTDQWMDNALARINTRIEDIDALAVSLEHARTCQYISNQPDWLPDPDHWRRRTRAIEDEISDNLHRRLVDLFVDARASRIARLVRQGRRPVATVNEEGAIVVEDAIVGRLDGFRIQPSQPTGNPPTEAESRAAQAAARDALSDRVQEFLAADSSAIETRLRFLLWRGDEVATLSQGEDSLRPQAHALMADFAGPEERGRVQQKLQNHLDAMLRRDFTCLFALRNNEQLTPAARGIAYRVAEALGILPRAPVASEIRALPQTERKLLRAHGVRFGSRYIFLPALLKPSPTRLRLSIWSLGVESGPLPEPPAPGIVNMPAGPEHTQEFLRMCGFHRCGERAVRIDMLERLLDMVRDSETVGEWFPATLDMLSITGSSAEDLREIMRGLGYDAEPLTDEDLPPPGNARPGELQSAQTGPGEMAKGPPAPGPNPRASLPEEARSPSDGPARTESPSGGSVPPAAGSAAVRGAGFRYRRRPRRNREREQTKRRNPATGRRPGRPGARPELPTKGAPSGERTRRKTPGEKETRAPRSRRKEARKPDFDPNSPFAVLAGLRFGDKQDPPKE